MQNTSNNHSLTKTNMGLSNTPEAQPEQQAEQLSEGKDKSEKISEAQYEKMMKSYSDFSELVDGLESGQAGKYKFEKSRDAIAISKGEEKLVFSKTSSEAGFGYQGGNCLHLHYNEEEVSNVFANWGKGSIPPIDKREESQYSAVDLKLMQVKLAKFIKVLKSNENKRDSEKRKKNQERRKKVVQFNTETE